MYSYDIHGYRILPDTNTQLGGEMEEDRDWLIISMALVLFVASIWFALTPKPTSRTWEERIITPIVSMDKQLVTSGWFSYRSGYIESKMYYFFNRPTGENKYRLISIPTESTEIITSLEKPKVIEIRRNREICLNSCSTEEIAVRKFEVHIPKNSSAMQFNP